MSTLHSKLELNRSVFLKFNGKHLASVFREDKKLLNLFVQIEARTSKGFKDKRRKACTAVVLGI